jgi:membrane protease YdiL (CAAX protease family)
MDERERLETARDQPNGLTLPTAIALTLALSAPLLQLGLVPTLKANLPDTAARLTSLLVFWVVMAVVLLIAAYWEHIPMGTFGFRRYSKGRSAFIRDFCYAALIGLGLLFLLLPLSTYARGWITGEEVQLPSELTVAVSPLVLLAGWATGSFVEEVLFRSYPIERLIVITGNRWLAGGLTLTLFVLQHLYSWDWIHVLTVVLPGGLALTLTYLWKRSLMVNVIIHAGINFPFLVAAVFLPSLAPYL